MQLQYRLKETKSRKTFPSVRLYGWVVYFRVLRTDWFGRPADDLFIRRETGFSTALSDEKLAAGLQTVL